MSFGDLGKSFERLMRCTDNALQTGTDAGPQRQTANHAYHKCLRTTNEIWKRLEVRVHQATGHEKASPARAWLDTHLERKLFFRMEILLITVRDNAEVAACSTASATTRQDAAARVLGAGYTAFMLLLHACSMVSAVQFGRSKSDQYLGQKALSAMAQRSFMKAVAEASRGMAATAAYVRAAAGADGGSASKYPIKHIKDRVFDVDSATSHQYVLTSLRAVALCRYASDMTQLLLRHLRATALTPTGRTGLTFLPAASQLADSLADSQLLTAVADVIVNSPSAMAIEADSSALCDGVCCHLRAASRDAAQALTGMAASKEMVRALGGSEGRRLACRLLRATRHVAVRRLQVALLDQLAAHAGMGVELGGGEEGEEQQQQGQGGNQADGWAGSNGAWWFAREEAQRGQLLGVPDEAGEAARSQTAGWLEYYHYRIVCATLWDWGSAGPQLAAEAGVPAAPPPLLRARLAARAAEALCRLYRGKGLGGAYAPSPEWSHASVKVLSFGLVHKRQVGLPTSTVQACLPYWLETAGWAAAVLSDAAAAAMGRLPATKSSRLPLSPIKSWALMGTEPPGLLTTLVDDMVTFSLYDHEGFQALPAAAKDDVRRRLSRCGLAASLDHTLRLLYSAEDSNQAGAVDLTSTISWGTRMLLESGMMRLLPSAKAVRGNVTDRISPTEPGACSSGGGSSCGGSYGYSGDSSNGGSSSGRDSSCGTGIKGGASGGGASSSTPVDGSESSDPLGLLLTLSKRAAMLTRTLGAVSASWPAQGDAQEQGPALKASRVQQVVRSAGDVLALLHVALRSVQVDVGPREWEARKAAANIASGKPVGAACQAPGAAGADEAHEALALAAQAACNLAAPLAWQLAAQPFDASNADCLDVVGHAVQGLLLCMEDWCSCPLALPTAHLLACQPHRLLAGACALAAALPAHSEHKQPLRVGIGCLLDALSSHQTLGGRVRSWLAVPPVAAGGGAASSEATPDAEGDACAGCLAGPLRSVLKAAAGIGGLGTGSGAATDKALGCTAATSEVKMEGMEGSLASEDGESMLLFGSSATAALGEEGNGDGLGLQRPQSASATPAPLPPPLALPPGRAGGLPQLYMCGNPRCGNFGCEGEWALPLKHCGRCRVVRYCGADCQRAHWREGHRAECTASAQ